MATECRFRLGPSAQKSADYVKLMLLFLCRAWLPIPLTGCDRAARRSPRPRRGNVIAGRRTKTFMV